MPANGVGRRCVDADDLVDVVDLDDDVVVADVDDDDAVGCL